MSTVVEREKRRTELQKTADRFDCDLFRLILAADTMAKEDNERGKDSPWTAIKYRLIDARAGVRRLRHPDDVKAMP